MPPIVTGNDQHVVFSKTGSGDECKFPKLTFTHECSSNVTIQGHGVVRDGDKVKPHEKAGCSTDTSVLTTFSSKVFANGKAVAILGKQYTSDNIIISGSTKVFVGA